MCLSGIMLIYRNKGSTDNLNNARGISLLSCLGKLFTSCINKRLKDFVKEKMILLLDLNKLVLSLISPPFFSKRRRKYCCFVGYQKAFDTVNRSKSGTRLLLSGISGRILGKKLVSESEILRSDKWG